MKLENLKNYGKPLNETTMNLPLKTQALAFKDGMFVLIRNLGLATSLKVFADTRKERARMASVDLEEVRNKGCHDEKFISNMMGAAAFFTAMKNRVGRDKTMEVHRKIMDRVAGPMNLAVLPSSEEISKFQNSGGVFAAFKSYVMALWEANKQAGLHFFDVVEDSDKALAVNITYCAYCRIPQLLGVQEACESYCYSDEVFFPDFLKPFGIRFVRNQTLGRNGTHCDFRFEIMEE